MKIDVLNRFGSVVLCLAACGGIGVGAAPLPDGFAFDVFDETTGFAVHTKNDAWSVYTGGTWENSVNWTTQRPPESGVNYYSNGKTVYFPKTSTVGGHHFPGDLLAHDGLLVLPQASGRFSFTDFIGLPEGTVAIQSTGQGLIVLNQARFLTTAEEPFQWLVNATFSDDKTYPYEITLEEGLASPESVLTFVEDGVKAANVLWKFDVALTMDKADSFKGRIVLPDGKMLFKNEACDFAGTLELTNRWTGISETADGSAVTNTPGQLRTVGAASVKGLVLNEGTELLLDTRATERGDWTVGDLTMAGGAVSVTCERNGNTGKTLTVTNSLTIAGGHVFVIRNTAEPWGVVSTETIPSTNTVITFAKEVDLSGITAADFRLESQLFTGTFSNHVIAFPKLVLEALPDGGHRLCLTWNPVVYNRSYTDLGNRKSFEYDDATVWSDGKVPHAECDYLIAFNEKQPQLYFDARDEEDEKIVFPAENLFARNAEIFPLSRLTVSNLVMGNKSCLHVTTGGAKYGIQGRIGVFSETAALGNMAHITVKPDIAYEVASALYGPGGLRVRGPGVTLFSGNNAAFSGRLFSVEDGSTFRIANATALGGAMTSFTPDGVLLGKDGDGVFLEPTSSFRVAEPTRGIMITNLATWVVGEGIEFGVDSILTYNGRLVKTGAGTLSLGARPRFGDGGVETLPSAGLNELVVSEGVLTVTDAEALDGVHVRLDTAASLAFGRDPVGELATYGLIMTREGSSLAGSADGFCRVTLDVDEDFENGTQVNLVTVGNETAAHDTAAALRVTFKNPVPRAGLKTQIVPNGDGTYTIRAEIRRTGFTFVVK